MTTQTPTKTSTPVVFQPTLLADDDRGLIQKLNTSDEQSVLRITSKKGSVRANHYHQHDSHVCYLVAGKIRYVERPLNKDPQTGAITLQDESTQTEHIIQPGQCFYTAPMLAHAMEFLEDSEFLAISPRSGDSTAYEDDIIRVVLVDPKEAAHRAGN